VLDTGIQGRMAMNPPPRIAGSMSAMAKDAHSAFVCPERCQSPSVIS
jgi:hypothetical protein